MIHFCFHLSSHEGAPTLTFFIHPSIKASNAEPEISSPRPCVSPWAGGQAGSPAAPPSRIAWHSFDLVPACLLACRHDMAWAWRGHGVACQVVCGRTARSPPPGLNTPEPGRLPGRAISGTCKQRRASVCLVRGGHVRRKGTRCKMGAGLPNRKRGRRDGTLTGIGGI
ncbi:hypothetical protein LX36DRAFT_382145 [Colletotrichum falcatum]|nr:hypothetical protein LX36DRAFT_382145 [Colletotrichum falcatum]